MDAENVVVSLDKPEIRNSKDPVVIANVHRRKQVLFDELEKWSDENQSLHEKKGREPSKEELEGSSEEKKQVIRAMGRLTEESTWDLKNQRHSQELWYILRWLGDDAAQRLSYQEADEQYYYDSRRVGGAKVPNRYRRWEDGREVVSHLYRNVDKGMQRLYDTTDLGKVQMTEYALVDCMRRLGFTLDLSDEKTSLVAHTDIGKSDIAEEKLNFLRKFLPQSQEQRGFALLPHFLYPDEWLKNGHGSQLVVGTRLQDSIRGKSIGPNHIQTPDGDIYSLALSNLCQEWDHDRLYAELACRRNGQDLYMGIGMSTTPPINSNAKKEIVQV